MTYFVKKLSLAFRVWVCGAGLITLMCGLVYGAVQQSIRQGANDPQIQMAEDVAAALTKGESPDSVAQGTFVDLKPGYSLAPFIIIYSEAGEPIAGDGRIDGALPKPPPGVFAYVREHGQDRVTWQPEPDIRIAAVVQKISDRSGFALAGRSLREVEIREIRLSYQVGIAWIVLVAFLSFCLLVFL